MKLIIDIPKDVYKRTVFYREFRDLNDCVTTLKALENGTPLEEELKKIKAEIMSIGNWREIYEVPNGYVVECLNIIDKHITELKGENNG